MWLYQLQVLKLALIFLHHRVVQPSMKTGLIRRTVLMDCAEFPFQNGRLRRLHK